MITCELNIRIDAIDLPNDRATIERRAGDTVAVLQRFGAVAERWVVTGSAHKLVAQVLADDVPHDLLHSFAADLHQDCIAVYYPATGEGRLVGPRAGRWGWFRVADFERYVSPDSIEFVATPLPQDVKPKKEPAAMR